MSMISRQAVYQESAAYGGLVDVVGGVATMVLAVCGLAGLHPPLMVAIATIVFGIALLVQGGSMLSEYVQIALPPASAAPSASEFSSSGLSMLFLAGAAGVVLGVLALLGVAPAVLAPVATIAFGTALALSSRAVWNLYGLARAATQVERPVEASGGEIIASEMASGSAGIQAIAGVGAIVLGLVAVAGGGAAHDLTLVLVALLGLGATIVMTGGSLSATVLSLTRRS